MLENSHQHHHVTRLNPIQFSGVSQPKLQHPRHTRYPYIGFWFDGSFLLYSSKLNIQIFLLMGFWPLEITPATIDKTSISFIARNFCEKLYCLHGIVLCIIYAETVSISLKMLCFTYSWYTFCWPFRLSKRTRDKKNTKQIKPE